MPNAHTHLAAVADLLNQPELTVAVPWISNNEPQSAFLLGAIGPDARAVSGQPREATHFFNIPPEDNALAQDVMLRSYPILHLAASLTPARAAFVAGYMTHLVMDQTWLEVVVMPGLFIDGLAWGTHHPNWRLYSILMTWLEYRAAARLRKEIAPSLASAQPDSWLPFIQDRHLVQWRDHVVNMIHTEGARRTSVIFAQTNNLTAQELEDIVLSEARMAEQAYPTLAPDRLAEFEATTARRSLAAILQYLAAV
jgi:hypothetical protein